MRNARHQILDDATAEWYAYHFDDSLLQYDVHWRMWRDTAHSFLEPQQLNGQTCAICNAQLTAQTVYRDEFVGGYRLRICAVRCDFIDLRFDLPT